MSVDFDLLDRLTEAQKDAVQYHEGPLLIIAGPGSGKTEVISRRAAYLIMNEYTKPENLLVTTFTEKAALELKDRIQQNLPEQNVELMQVSTIHSFCNALLTEFRDASPCPKGFHILDEAAQLLFVYSHRKDLGLGDIIKGRESDFFSEVLGTFNLATEELVRPDKFVEYCEKKLEEAEEDEEALWEERASIARSYEQYLEMLVESNVTDFSNLQRYTLEMISKHEEILRQIQYRYTDVLIDEYQDTNAVQELILGKIAAPHMYLAVVGDDDQSIYRFRGATVKNILNFSEKYEPVKIVMLEDNFRSLEPIVSHCSRLIKCNEARSDKNLRCVRDDIKNDILRVHEITSKEEAESVVDILQKMISKGIIKQYRDAAILLRSVRSHAGPYLEELEKHQIPHVVTRDGRFFDREDISEVCHLFTYLGASKPWGDKFIRCSLMMFTGETKGALEQFKQDLGSITNEEELKEIGVLDELDRRKIMEMIALKKKVQNREHKSLLEVLYEILRISGYFKKKEEEKDADAIRNLGILTRIVGEFDDYGGTTVLYPFLSYIKMLKQSALDSFVKPPEDAVQVMTVHQAKGLEFPAVVIGAAMEGRFPTRIRRKKYEIPYELMQSGEPEVVDHHLVDERKLFYVAATRARDFLIIGTSDIVNKRGGGPSRFVQELLGKDTEGALERSREILESKDIKIFSQEKKSQGPRMRLSYSRLVHFLQCPIRYKYFEIDGIETPRPSYMFYGASVHRALEMMHKDLIDGKEVLAEDIEKYVDEAWLPSPWMKENEEEALKTAAVRWLQVYFEKHGSTFPLLFKAEEKFSFDMEDVVIAGKIDLIRKADGDGEAREIVDFKTSKSKTAWQDQTDLQMKLYAIGAEQSLKMQVERCSIHFLSDNKVVPGEWNEKKAEEAEYFLKDMINKIKEQKFEPRHDYCPFCREFKDICPYFEGKGRKA